MFARNIKPFLRPILWTAAVFLLLGLFLSLVLPLAEWERWALRLVFTLSGIYWVGMAIFLAPRYGLREWVTYVNVTVACGTIALSDYLFGRVDLSPLYVVVILIVAMLWDRRAALFAAVLASALTLLIALAPLNQPPVEPVHLFFNLLIYFASALLVSHLTTTLTNRWQAAAAQAEQRRQEIVRRTDELEGLHGLSQAFGNLEDADATFREVTQRIARFLGVKICAIAILNPENGQLQGAPPGYGISDESVRALKFPFSDDKTHSIESFKNDHVLFNDLTALPASIREYAARQNIREFVTARMMLRGRPTGLILAANKISGSGFDEEDGRLLSILAGQAAMAVENARLHQEAQTNLRDLTRLYAVSTQLAVHSRPDEIPRHVVQGIADALDAPSATIALRNESTGILEYSATVGVPADALKVPFRENGIGMTVMNTGAAHFIEDVQTAREVSPVTRVWGYRATACLPIQRGGKSVGVLYVNYPEPHIFTDNEKNMLAIFANQTAIALENAQLWYAEQTKSIELGALANLSRSLAETMDLEDMFHVFERQVRANIPAAEGGALLIYDSQRAALVPRASFGYDREILQMVAIQPGESAAGRVYQTNQPVRLSGQEAVKEARRRMQPDNQALFAAASPWGGIPQSMISAPLSASGETMGSIVLDNSSSPQAFTQDDLQLLVAMADRIALAIHNAQLFARERRRAAQLATVNELGHRVSSILDMDELAQTLVRLIRDKFEYRYVHLLINDPSKNETVLRAGAGPTMTELVPGRFILPFDQGIVGWTAAHGETLLANDVSKEARFQYHPAVADTRSEIAIPLTMSARVIGVLDIQSEQLNAFDPSDVATLETLAGQIAITLENARLYGEVQEQAHRDSLTQVYNHGYFLERFSEELACARRETQPLALIMLDVDYFKEYNDAYGHVVGDQVLVKIVQAIRAHVHHTDLVGRWGGEEFGIALLRTDAAGALRVAERIRQTLAATRVENRDGATIPSPTVSQGIASYPAHTQDAATLIDLADAALYRAKSHGRDQICVTGAKCS